MFRLFSSPSRTDAQALLTNATHEVQAMSPFRSSILAETSQSWCQSYSYQFEEVLSNYTLRSLFKDYMEKVTHNSGLCYKNVTTQVLTLL